MFWQWFFHRRSVLETLRQCARLLPLKEVKFQRLPVPTAAGSYLGFPLVLEGGKKKEGWRFLAVVELPRKLAGRYFLAHESRKTSLKPIASLQWITTTHARFNQNYLLLSDRVAAAQAVFQNYLCGKIAALPECVWQMDVHGESAHAEILLPRLNASVLSDLLRAVAEVLNAIRTAEAANQNVAAA